MDWNNDGKVDWKDYALLDSATSNVDKEDYSGGDIGCLPWVLIGLIIFQILDWMV